jgi:hypothetical protein
MFIMAHDRLPQLSHAASSRHFAKLIRNFLRAIHTRVDILKRHYLQLDLDGERGLKSGITQRDDDDGGDGAGKVAMIAPVAAETTAPPGFAAPEAPPNMPPSFPPMA